ncbi:hypothetical protein GCM10025789_15230 [Tessaracoccus lubricantis]|uniref:Pectate lyase superfamily protein domain-containing protein n=1 Tax=Tessaracoccus lubricantis TaxID=545543 RepID=A0ABP9FI35_9ACTN
MRLRPAAVVTALITSLGLALTPSAAPAAPTVPAEAGETVISVTSFGADPTGVEDSAVAVKAAVAAAKDADGPVRIVFPRGVYQLYPDHAERRELYFSNTIGTNLAYKDKTIAVLLEDMTDVTVDGQGSVFMMHGQQSVFGIRTSQQLQGTTYPEPAAVAYTTTATGTWPNSTAAKTVTFDAPIEARYVKLTSTSAVGGQAWASAAELLPGGEPAGVPGELADVPLVPRSTASPSPSVSPTPSKSPSAKPSLTPSVKPSATPTTGTGKFVRTAPYTKPGTHLLNGRQWMTVCEDYSQTERCRTEIWATIVVIEDGSFMRKSGWAFNNLTYLPYMTREAWNGNPLGDLGSTANGVFTSAGRQWKTECDTAATGRGACRSYTWTTVYAAIAKPEGGYAFSQGNQWIFNNIVMFEN